MNVDVEDIQYQLPLTYTFTKNEFYVRNCYLEYYYLIMISLFNSKLKYNYITLTGTPGNGKSGFYIYFFHRFKKENPTVTIVTAAFNKYNHLKECMVFEPGNVPPRTEREIPVISGAIYLYDGPPHAEPPDNKMVCFTCPNYRWLGSMFKNITHLVLYFPSWTLEELQYANEKLSLNLDALEIQERFSIFGGSARYCLSLNDDFVADMRESILSTIGRITTISQIRDLIRETANSPESRHRIFQLMPSSLGPFPIPAHFQYAFASEKIRELVENSLSKEEECKLLDFAETMTLTLSGKYLAEWILEKVCKDVFKSGGNFCCRSLDGNEDLFIPVDSYTPSPRDNLESPRGYMIIGNALFIFQFSTNLSSPVNANGIVEFMKRIHWQSENPIRLIFVVPKRLAEFKRQQVIEGKATNDESKELESYIPNYHEFVANIPQHLLVLERADFKYWSV